MNMRLFLIHVSLLIITLHQVPLIHAQADPKPTAEHDTRIQCTRTGQDIQIEQLLDAVENCDVIVLGEQHDNDSGHHFQFAVIEGLVNRGHAIAISMEQFERDTQGSLNDYLTGRINEQMFLASSRPWNNYKNHYRPIIELAKQKKLPVIAGNIPRRIAGEIAAGKEINFADQAYAPRGTTAPKDVYWQKFKATMEGHMGTDSDGKMEKFYASQCLKDDAMAEGITDYLAGNTHQRKIVVHLCGHFHSDYGLGTVARIVSRRPLTQVTVITMEGVDADKKKTKPDELKNRAHYVFWTVKNPSEESTTSTKK